MSERIDKFIKQHKEYFKRNATVIESNYWYKEEDLSRKAKLFKQENDLTTSIVGRLSAFIKIAEADRRLPKTQKFIDETLEIIQNLYEKKLVTYPRTDARVLSSAVAKEIKKNLNGLATKFQDEEIKEIKRCEGKD